jgi:hypothetical protein
LLQKIISLFLAIALIVGLLIYEPVAACFPGCTENGSFRGDWSAAIDRNYEIRRVNSRGISICKRASDSAARILIDRYFLTAFCVAEPYLLFEGIPTEGEYLSDREKEEHRLCYYAIDTTNDKVIGPFDTAEALFATLNLSGIEWTPISDPPDLPNVNY